MPKKKPEFVSNGGMLSYIPENVLATIKDDEAEAAKYTVEDNYQWDIKMRLKHGKPPVTFEEFKKLHK
jgi:hypothetical protein